jgi:small-conductance mechanosensitive channel
MTEPRATQQIEQDARKKAPLFGRFARIALATLTALLFVGAMVSWETHDAMADLPFLRQGPSGQAKTLVDETPWKTAEALMALAVSQEELALARQAEHLADHEVDQAFATALRESSLKQRTLTGDALALQRKVTQFTALVATDQAALASVAKGGDDEQIAQAQLGLDQDELSDAKGDLARASGDQRDEIQQELTARDAEVKKFEGSSGVGEVAVLAVKRYRTLAGLIAAWQQQSKREGLVLQARSAVESDAKKLTAEHNALEVKSDQGAAASVDRLTSIKRMALERQLMSLYDDRIATEGQLAGVYTQWAAQVALQHRIVGHLIVVQMIVVIVILLVGILLTALVKRLAERDVSDPRRARTLSWIARLSVQVVVLLSVLMVVFGKPDQLSTIVGLTTAGLTVALQDFILAFVGWFILMGKNGIGVGDVVEVNSVQGEVIDIGVFRTTLLETGNWASTGHPTGRRVAFNNKFAISGQFFNFSTAGQWMWDEFTVTVPTDEDTAATVERVQKTVAAETEADSKSAEREWIQVSRKHGLSQFSAEPAVNVRPVGAGVELVVRYVTRATGRFERRNTLSQTVLDSLRSVKETEGAKAG